MNKNKEFLSKKLSMIALGYDKTLVTPEILKEIKKQDFIRQIRNPQYMVSFNIGLKLFLLSILMFVLEAVLNMPLFYDIGKYMITSAGFFFIGWIILRSVR